MLCEWYFLKVRIKQVRITHDFAVIDTNIIKIIIISFVH